MNQQVILDKAVVIFKEELEESLVGVYLHGSMAMGCFNPFQSDVDILVVVKEKRAKEAYRRIAARLIALEEEMKMHRGFEISAVLETYAADFVYPTPFEFHYSSVHREKYKADENYFCGGFVDPDLAAHFVITYNRGVVLFGTAIKEVFQPVQHQYYLDSIKADVSEALERITQEPVYYVLNLLRVLLYIKESAISSKQEAGEWALHNVPVQYSHMIAVCLQKYANKLENLNLNQDLLLEFSEYVLIEIEKTESAQR